MDFDLIGDLSNVVDLDKSDADAATPHTVLLMRCVRNFLRQSREYPSLIPLAIDEIADADEQMLETAGAEELKAATSFAVQLRDRHKQGDGTGRRRRKRDEKIKHSPEDLRELLTLIEAFLDQVPEISGVIGSIAANMKHMETLFGLGADECQVLLLSMACEISSQVDTFLDRAMGRAKSLEAVVGACLGLSAVRAREIVSPTGKIAVSGVARITRGHRWFAKAVDVHTAFQVLTGYHNTVDDLRVALVGSPLVSDLSISDFPHIAKDAEAISRLLTTAKRDGVKGINVLIHGKVGVGKTSIAKAIMATHSLYAIGEADEEGHEVDRDKRMHLLMVAQHVLKGQADSFLLVDEGEDVLVPFRRGKVWINRLLENNEIPTIYLINDAEDVSDAVKRRMSMVMEIHSPPASVRQTIVRRIFQDQGLAAEDGDVARVAAIGNVAPGVLSKAAQATALSGGTINSLIEGAKAITRTLASYQNEPTSVPTHYDPRFISADQDVTYLIDRLAASQHRDFSLLMLGPPGTGKSATARELARRLDMPVLQVGSAQVLRPFVGETEQMLASLFERARREQSFLVFDEVDSLAFNRANATRAFEVSHTNTFLELLQDHPLPMACCTNAAASRDRLDPAILRRFVFKLQMNYLTPAAANGLFEHMFALPPPVALARLAMLTPGDFSVVLRKAGFLGCGRDADALCKMLAAECEIKGERTQSIGFSLPSPDKVKLVA